MSEIEELIKIEDDNEFLQRALRKVEGIPNSKKKGLAIIMVNGSGKGSSKQLFLSPAHDCLCWESTGFLSMVSMRLKQVDICDITMILKGQVTTAFQRKKQNVKPGSKVDDNEPKRSFSVLTHHGTLDIIAPSFEEAKLWTRTLGLLHYNSGGDREYHGDITVRYITEQWNRADLDRDELLTFDEVVVLMRKMNYEVKKKWLKEQIKSKDVKGMTSNEFHELMIKLMSNRKEVATLMKDIKQKYKQARLQQERTPEAAKDQEYLTVAELLYFLNHVQRMDGEPELTLEEVNAMIEVDKIENIVSTLQLAKILDNASNSIFHPVATSCGCGDEVTRYMSRPLSHYWINSSHNTYLTGDQLRGVSTAEQYAQVLQSGCRCVELDCWDGERDVPFGNDGTEPIITHGHTLCTKILFRDVILAIKKSAFGPPANNPYPIILSIEMHCSATFQDRMHEICQEEIGDIIVTLPDDVELNGMAELPSPEELKGKILFKGKVPKAHATIVPEDEPPSESDPDEVPDPAVEQSLAEKRKKKTSKRKDKRAAGNVDTFADNVKTAQEAALFDEMRRSQSLRRATSGEWRKIIYLRGFNFKTYKHPGQAFHIISFSEGKCKKMCCSSRDDFIEFNKKQIARVYPWGGRIDSSNQDPILPWASGVQMVAMNFQTGDLPMWLNRGKFAENGGQGYVLKPPFMRSTGPSLAAIRLTVTVLSCQRLPNNNAAYDIADVYVQVSLLGVSGDTAEKSTSIFNNNGLNPAFSDGNGETFVFHVAEREVAMLKLVALDSDIGTDTVMGQCCIPLSCVRTGYRHVPLYDEFNTRFKFASILCKIQIDETE